MPGKGSVVDPLPIDIEIFVDQADFVVWQADTALDHVHPWPLGRSEDYDVPAAHRPRGKQLLLEPGRGRTEDEAIDEEMVADE